MIRVSSFGKLKASWRDDLIKKTQRLIPFEWREIDLKRCPDQRTTKLLPEEQKFLKDIHEKEFYLLDVVGDPLSSEAFYKFLFNSQERHLVVGPAIGFHDEFRKKARGSLALSSLTFTHSMAQHMLAESIYRSACMLKNHPFVK